MVERGDIPRDVPGQRLISLTDYGRISPNMQNYPTGTDGADTFICHASEDKESIARPLRDALKEIGITAWLDESEVRVGDSIRRKIDQGLATCRSATVILSRTFFEKHWTQYEMDGIFQRQVPGEIPIFPVRHGITVEEIRERSPSLADLSSLNDSDQTIKRIATQIADKISQLKSPMAAPTPTPEPVAHGGTAGRDFGVFYVAPAGTPELPHGSEPDATPPFFNQEPGGWIPMVNNKDELEYILEDTILRIRLDWGNTLQGSEIQASLLVSGGKPLALTIRPAHGKQIYLPSVISQNQGNWVTRHRNPSGWMTFSIQ